MLASLGRKGAAAAGSWKNPPKAVPDRETSRRRRPVSFDWAHLEKPHRCPRRLERLPCQREPQLHRPDRDRLRLRDRWVAKLVHLPEHQGLSRHGETGCWAPPRSQPGAEAEIPWAGRKGGAGWAWHPRKRHSSDGKTGGSSDLFGRTVAVHAGDLVMSSSGRESKMPRTGRGTAAMGLSH